MIVPTDDFKSDNSMKGIGLADIENAHYVKDAYQTSSNILEYYIRLELTKKGETIKKEARAYDVIHKESYFEELSSKNIKIDNNVIVAKIIKESL